MTGVMCFGKNRKLIPRYIGVYLILMHFSSRAYKLDLLLELVLVHPLFRISLLKKFIGDPASLMSLESVAVKEKLSYEEVTLEIQDCQVQKMRNEEVTSVKVLWQNHLVEGATLEVEADMMSRYPHFFTSTLVLVCGIRFSYKLFQNLGVLAIFMIP